MASFATLTLPDQATKMRFKEPFVSEAQNLKDGGIIPPGVFRGFVPSPLPGFLMNFNLDPVRNDSVAVVETLAAYNLTVRAVAPITLDMTGQVIFPVYVVLRTEYQITPVPLGGLTTSKVMVVQTAVDNGDPQKLHDDDVKLCKVLGFVGTVPSITTVIPGDRMDNGGPLVARNQVRVGIDGINVISGDLNRNVAFNSPVPGTLLNIPTGVGKMKISVCTQWVDGGSTVFIAAAGARIDGVDYTLASAAIQCGAGADHIFGWTLAGSIVLPCTAGNHTFELLASSSGSNGPWSMKGQPTQPASIMVEYPTP